MWHKYIPVASVRRAAERILYQALPMSFLLECVQRNKDRSTSQNDQNRFKQARIEGAENLIFAPTNSRLGFRVRVPDASYVTGGVDVRRENTAWEGEGSFLVGVEEHGKFEILVHGSIPPKNGRSQDARFLVDLRRFAGKEIDLIFKTVILEDKQIEPVVTWINPKILRKRRFREYLAKIMQRLRGGGLRSIVQELLCLFLDTPPLPNSPAGYQRWIEHRELKETDIRKISEEISQFRYKPVISILTPVHNTDLSHLEGCIESVRKQLYPHWQLCLVDDASTTSEVRQMLAKYQSLDDRIKARFLKSKQNISRASNECLAIAEGTFIALLDHDDELTADALFEVVKLLQQKPEADVIYSDEDKLENDGTRSEPFFKPDWSPEYLWSCMYTCHLGVYRRDLVDRVGGFRPGFEGSQDYDLMLRLVEQTDRVLHIPKILYHWRKVPGSTAATFDAKSYTTAAGWRALQEHLQRMKINAEVVETFQPNTYRVKPKIAGQPLISIIVPTKDKLSLLRRCIHSIENKTTYANYEILIVDNNSRLEETREFLATTPHRVIRFTQAFNYSRINNLASQQAKGEYLLFLNNDVEVISSEWLSALLEFAQQNKVGIVGAKLYYPNGRIQHAGVILGIRGIAGNWHRNFEHESPGYFNSLFVIRNYSAVTAACMMMRRSVFETVGGFDEKLAVAFNDVDLCLRVREAGLRIVWTPYAELYHHESATRGYDLDPTELDYMRTRWGAALLRDPYYNPNLTLDAEDFGLRA